MKNLVKIFKEQDGLLQEDIEAAQEVVNCWSSGDLAGAVNNLEGWVESVLKFKNKTAKSLERD
ncbi:hypothetical protein [Methylocaldum szegediense]|uniref:hypothetical protein n=1 Tax=Methylocaldum szegediense TaxID=73780 RepID=UPI0004168EF3|nr:hypothetical protein [Methylocaldum szegediense]